ncbi:unnamed protein product [Rhizoctonia solani]|uniref:Fungal-type protein kinase domain-containing protein n=1 Tax=Rhizoctonia solani TaxID=456999 RepID=A0A8H3E486_9AGAM|nr:unnamed protein product [Rhizoctonia solani]
MPSTRSTRSNTGLTNTSKPPMPAKRSKPSFIDNSKYSIPSDRAETELIKPDLVLFEVEEKHKHWEHVRLPIEVKKLPGHQKAAMKQLSRYARALFAHQIHRHHLYAMMVCGTEATFVRFDRAGILYSSRIDILKKPKAFTEAFASLLLLDRTDQGYNPAFTCEMNEQGRLAYSVDLPASAFATQEPTTESTTSEENNTRRFEVAETLCHRKSICGRATIVLRIRTKDNREEYILKIMWRDPERDSEGEVLRQVKGKFGVAQYVWHRDACGKCRCSKKATGPWGCFECVAETPQLEELEICEQMANIRISVPPEAEAGEKEVELTVVDTTTYRRTSQRRPHRICAFLVISSKGVPLEQAKSQKEFMQAVLDAILGYWGLFNAGILHRDISEGNVLILRSGDKSADPEASDQTLTESEKKLRKVLKGRGRVSTGMLTDLDLHAKIVATPGETTAGNGSNPPKDNRLIDFRTGTLAFMSIRVVQVKAGERYYHTFLDDIESFFWLVLWSAAAHLDPGERPTAAAQKILDHLTDHDPDSMALKKKALLGDCTDGGLEMRDNLTAFSNPWASHPLFSDVILKFGALAHKYHKGVRKRKVLLPANVFPAVVGIFQKALSKYPD